MPDWDAHICPDCVTPCVFGTAVIAPVIQCDTFVPKNCLRSTLEVLDMAGDPLDWPLEERPTLYLAGFYSANPAHGIANVCKWFQPALDAGWLPIVPHASFIVDVVCPRPSEFWYAADRGLLRRCDGIFICPDELSSVSTGVRDEIAYAEANDIPVYREMVRAKDRYAK